jgi:hypothetical protein
VFVLGTDAGTLVMGSVGGGPGLITTTGTITMGTIGGVTAESLTMGFVTLGDVAEMLTMGIVGGASVLCAVTESFAMCSPFDSNRDQNCWTSSVSPTEHTISLVSPSFCSVTVNGGKSGSLNNSSLWKAVTSHFMAFSSECSWLKL